MPLATCPECGHEVPAEAITCIHCGKPMPLTAPDFSGAVPPPQEGTDENQPAQSAQMVPITPKEEKTDQPSPAESVPLKPEAPPPDGGYRARRDILKTPIPMSFLILGAAIAYVISPYDLVPEYPYIRWIDDFLITLCAVFNLIHSLTSDKNKTMNIVMRRVKLMTFIVTASTIVIMSAGLLIISLIFGK